MFCDGFEAGIKHYPEELGLLFRKNRKGSTAYMPAFERRGEVESWKIINESLDEAQD